MRLLLIGYEEKKSYESTLSQLVIQIFCLIKIKFIHIHSLRNDDVHSTSN